MWVSPPVKSAAFDHMSVPEPPLLRYNVSRPLPVVPRAMSSPFDDTPTSSPSISC